MFNITTACSNYTHTYTCIHVYILYIYSQSIAGGKFLRSLTAIVVASHMAIQRLSIIYYICVLFNTYSFSSYTRHYRVQCKEIGNIHIIYVSNTHMLHRFQKFLHIPYYVQVKYNITAVELSSGDTDI
jgi:hypothetical protein